MFFLAHERYSKFTQKVRDADMRIEVVKMRIDYDNMFYDYLHKVYPKKENASNALQLFCSFLEIHFGLKVVGGVPNICREIENEIENASSSINLTIWYTFSLKMVQ